MEVRNCPKCRKVFVFIKSLYCPDCEKKEDEIFEIVRKYIKDNPDNNISQVSNETSVSVKKIQSYIRDGKIDIGTSKAIEVQCESCGKKINTGRYCENCIGKIQTQVHDMFDKDKYTGPVMHTRKHL